MDRLRPHGYLVACLATLAALLPLVGCSTPSKGGFTLLPSVNALGHRAAKLRAATPPPCIPRELEKQVAEPYTVEPGDVLLVQPASLESPVRLPGDQLVLPDGTIQLGCHGRMQVAGKTVELIETEVNALIRATIPDAGPIVVRLAARDSKVFYVLGEVNAPGAFPLRGRETVLDAILAAGGLNSNASRRRIVLTRPTPPCSCRIVLPVDYHAIVQEGDTTTNYQIRAGDRVFVPTRTFWEDLCAYTKGVTDKPTACVSPCEAQPPLYVAPPNGGTLPVPSPDRTLGMPSQSAPSTQPSQTPPPLLDLPQAQESR